MKLNPPASSSDLEAAREIARRLHQRRRRADFERTGSPAAGPAPADRPPAAAAIELVPPPAPRMPSPGSGAPVHRPPAAAPPVDARPALSHPPEPAPPSWDDAEPEEPSSGPLAGALGDLDDLGGPEAVEAAAPADSEAPEGSPEGDQGEEPADALVAGLPGVDVEIEEEETVSPDEMVGSAPAEAAPEGEDNPFREPLGGADIEPSTLPPPPEGAPAGDAEEVFDEPAPAPAWDDVVETCRGLAGATGAMIIDPAGQVFAARGDWPEPGPDAIASRLVVMMERTLKDAPTRSVSAPVGGQHLTAWRVPISEGLLTAAFIADAPLRSEVRAAIDAEIHRGAGA
jgi:hypothetical protein